MLKEWVSHSFAFVKEEYFLMASNVIAKLTEVVSEICNENGAYLYDMELQKEGKNKVLRIFIDTKDGIKIDECETISRIISKKLDELDLIDGAYNLEVSSPGVERKLKTPYHYDLALEKKVEVSLYSPIDGEKSFVGVLKSHNESEISIDVDGTKKTFEKNKISNSKIYFDINEFLKSKDV